MNFWGHLCCSLKVFLCSIEKTYGRLLSFSSSLLPSSPIILPPFTLLEFLTKFQTKRIFCCPATWRVYLASWFFCWEWGLCWLYCKYWYSFGLYMCHFPWAGSKLLETAFKCSGNSRSIPYKIRWASLILNFMQLHRSNGWSKLGRKLQ